MLFGKNFFSRWLSPRRSDPRVDAIYEEKDYLEAYREHTDLRVAADPHAAIGGSWEEIGQLQYEFLLRKNLLPTHRLLDIGCGTLRGGRHFVRYLDAGRYTGMDISPKAIAFAAQLVQEEGLADKNPRLLVSENKDLKFDAFAGETFDYLLAQSVFTHLKPEHLEECFAHVGRVMHESSLFYFTYFQGETYGQKGPKSFRYPPGFFETLAERHGFRLRDHSSEYPHPSGQRMVEMAKKINRGAAAPAAAFPPSA